MEMNKEIKKENGVELPEETLNAVTGGVKENAGQHDTDQAQRGQRAEDKYTPSHRRDDRR